MTRQAIDLDTLAGLFDGHVDIRRRPNAVQPLRHPLADTGFLDPFTRWVASCAAGVRIRMISDMTSLRVASTQRSTGAAGPDARPANYELYIDGKLWKRQAATGGATLNAEGGLDGDERATVLFEGLPPGEKQMELWLPQTATVSITGVEVDDAANVAPWPDARKRIVFHGSSISHCMEADGGSGAWPAVACALADARLLNLGWAGSCLMSGLAARAIRDQPADGIVLKLGINVHGEGMLKERTFLDSAHSMISIIREKHAATPIVVVSPIFSASREQSGSAGGPSLARMRELLEGVVEARVRAGDEHIRYLSGLGLFDAADAPDLPDDLHPNAAGYRRMGERFYAQVLRDGRWLGGEALG
ncbi:MAG TPA: GDSL-type esterase/lipase family protein [Caulobacteraceae bacterium]|nr:GDSL-type esterase/lipase family protein [Caulobacteraceae bacterium]